MTTRYYAARPQFARELYWLWRSLQRGNLFFGTVVTLLGFYVLHSPGHSQVYDVGIPYLAATAHLIVLVFEQTRPERTGRSAAFYINLPRDTAPIFSASVVYFLGHAIYCQGLILLGVYLKLGGAEITPIYRIHPEIAALPFAAVLFALWYCRETRSSRYDLASVVVVALFVGLLIARDMTKPAASLDNNYLPPRDFSLVQEWGMACVLLGVAAAACWGVRDKRYAREGERA